MNINGAVSYLAGGVVFAALTVLLLTIWRTHVKGPTLAVGTGATSLWCAVLAWQAYSFSLTAPVLLLAEALRYGAWFAYLLKLLGGDDRRRLRSLVRWGIHAVWIVAAALALAAAMVGPVLMTSTIQGGGAILTALVLALTGLVLVEQVYRNVQPGRRWAVRYVILGLGAIFAYDLYLYANGVLFKEIDIDLWNSRGAINALVAPLIAMSVARKMELTRDLILSRRLVFFGTTLAAVGVYLLAMALGGYYIRSHAGTWGALAQTVFFVGAALVLIIILFSGQFRARVKVFLTKHLYRYKYDYREEWLRLMRTLWAPGTQLPLPTRAVTAVAQIVESSVGGLWIARDGEYMPNGGDFAGPDQPSQPADSNFVKFLLEKQWLVDLNEYRRDPSRYPSFDAPDWLIGNERAWLVLPLLHGDALAGFMVLGQPRVAHDLSWEDRDLLKTVGRQIGSDLAQFESARMLARAQQFETYNRLTAFIMHDLKNLVAQQSLVVRNATKFKDNPKFIEDAIKTIANSSQRMQRLIDQLRRGDVTAPPGPTSLSTLCGAVVEDCSNRDPVPSLSIESDELYANVSPDGLTSVIAHLVRNAQEATNGTGSVHVSVRRIGDEAIVTIEDDGCGMDRQFLREHLFNPFDTTKGSRGMGIGAYQAREFICQAGGRVEVDSEPGKGTRFLIGLPISQVEYAAKQSTNL